MQTMVSTHVWQRRTHRVIAMAVIIIGLTMMISTIPQCIYIGLVFIMMSLGWLAWMRMKDKKVEPPNPNNQPHAALSPVLFLVTSQNFAQRTNGPTPVDPNDRPPSYDQIIKLDGLPPDYFSILTAKPPRYEDIGILEKVWPICIPIDDVPMVHGACICQAMRSSNNNSGGSSSSSSSCATSSSYSNCQFSSVGLSVPSTNESESPEEQNREIKKESQKETSECESKMPTTDGDESC